MGMFPAEVEGTRLARFADVVLETSRIVDMSDDDGECSKCGGCCGRWLPVMSCEVDRIRAAVAAGKASPVRWDTLCPMLDGSGRCQVYEDRPLICRIYTCRAHRSLEIFQDPRWLLVSQLAEVTDMQAELFGEGEE